MLKYAILRGSGLSGYRQALPFFLGLILGDVVIASFWSLVGVILDARMYMFFPG